MPFIQAVPLSDFDDSNVAVVELPKEGLQIDDRVIGLDRHDFQFECSIFDENLTVEITNWTLEPNNDDDDLPTAPIVRDEEGGVMRADIFYFRVYDPDIERVPDFLAESRQNIYTYSGLVYERAPCNVKKVIVDSSVTIIRESAFAHCKHLTTCVMGDQVERIERNAFRSCKSLIDIRLSRNLRFIGENAFCKCISMTYFYIPPTVEDIKSFAFAHCSEMRYLVLPLGIDLHLTCRQGYFDIGGETSILENKISQKMNDRVELWFEHGCYDANRLYVVDDSSGEDADADEDTIITDGAVVAKVHDDDDHDIENDNDNDNENGVCGDHNMVDDDGVDQDNDDCYWEDCAGYEPEDYPNNEWIDEEAAAMEAEMEAYEIARQEEEAEKSIYYSNLWMRDYQFEHSPLHRLCLDPYITASVIDNFFQKHGTRAAFEKEEYYGWTPLHILVGINRHAASISLDAILACYRVNPGALIVQDDERCWTPLEYLWNSGNMDVFVYLIQDLCSRTCAVQEVKKETVGVGRLAK